jgi:hypothetical protein
MKPFSPASRELSVAITQESHDWDVFSFQPREMEILKKWVFWVSEIDTSTNINLACQPKLVNYHNYSDDITNRPFEPDVRIPFAVTTIQINML